MIKKCPCIQCILVKHDCYCNNMQQHCRSESEVKDIDENVEAFLFAETIIEGLSKALSGIECKGLCTVRQLLVIGGREVCLTLVTTPSVVCNRVGTFVWSMVINH
ncbi:hypothetical protein ILYODFUR_001037 [Ilyodon furcidens]|uniref:Uncharacterized protein n=1 Tax=Ilyodon furcidens TaxID=33524 RepID=A0ABV0U2B7_9TELE